MEVFLVAYTFFNLNLEIFTETRSNRQQHCMSILRYCKHHYDSMMNLLGSEVKTIFVLKFDS
jgi:hypothetical protein